MTTHPYSISVKSLDGLNASSFSADRINPLRHNFHTHELMQLHSLESLAESLMDVFGCRFIKPGTTAASAFDHSARPPDGRSLKEVFQRIEEPGAWIALYDVQRNPTYAQFLWDVIGSVQPLLVTQQKVFDVRGFIFISAPPSVTPFHIDRENNFWLQIRGRKLMEVWDHTDRIAVSAADVDSFVLSGSLQNVRLTDANASRSHKFDCGPGDGVYFPSTSPHLTRTDTSWVQPGNGVSISIGVVFYTDKTRYNAYIHACNRALRKLGMDPELPGSSATADALKHALGRSIVYAAKQLRGYKPPPGF